MELCYFQELRSVNEQLEKLQDKHKQQRLDFDRRMAEAYEECHNAQLEKVKMNTELAKEISKGKRVKRQLARERSKRKRVSWKLASEKSKVTRMEKRNKKVCKVRFLSLANFNFINSYYIYYFVHPGKPIQPLIFSFLLIFWVYNFSTGIEKEDYRS